MLHLCKTASIEGVMQVRGLRASEVSRAAGNALFSCISAEPINQALTVVDYRSGAIAVSSHHECAIIQVHQSRTDEMETTWRYNARTDVVLSHNLLTETRLRHTTHSTLPDRVPRVTVRCVSQSVGGRSLPASSLF